MAGTFHDWEVPPGDQPAPDGFAYDLDLALTSVVAVTARVPEEAFTAATLGAERRGSGVVIGEDGLVLTIGYLVAEAEQVWLTLAGGRVVQAMVIDYDSISGLGLVQALSSLDLPPMSLGRSESLSDGDRVVVAASGGRRRAISATVVARHEFAGYWEYVLDRAIFTAPAHPYWGGAALVGPQGALMGIGSLRLETRAFAGKILPINMIVPVELVLPMLERRMTLAPPPPARPWLGLFAHEADDDIVLSGVSDNGPAGRAGLRRGDVVVRVDGAPVTSLADFYRKVWSLGPAGVAVPLTLDREGDVFEVEIRSGDRSRARRAQKLH